MNLIVTKEFRGGIRFGNTIPWFLEEERRYFDYVTTFNRTSDKKNVLIMGRYTWETLNNSVLDKRINIVVSEKFDYLNGVQTHSDLFFKQSIKSAIELALSLTAAENIWIVGGRSIYEACFKYCSTLFYIDIHAQFLCDVFFPPLDTSFFSCVAEEVTDDKSLIFSKHVYQKRKNLNEQQYLNLIKDVLEKGVAKIDGTISFFGNTCRYDLTDGKIPLLTTKKMFWRAVVEELLWVIKGETNNETLIRRKVNVWTPNSVAFGSNDLGPVNGFQWRHFGATYEDCFSDYTNRGIDQLSHCINTIKTDPSSRRIVMIAWNPIDNDKMAFVPCQCLVQFNVSDGNLRTLVYQRSGDLGLGIPFNIASYALLTHLVASLTNLEAKELIHVIGDIHIYNNHIEALKEQILRMPNDCPTIIFKRVPQKIDEFTFDDISLKNYKHYDSIDLRVNI